MSDLFGLEKPHKITNGDEVSHLITVYDYSDMPKGAEEAFSVIFCER